MILLALAVSRAATAEIIQVSCDSGALGPAITAANTSAGATTLTLASGCVYTLTAALPTVTSDITIAGQGATVTRSTAGATPAFRIFTVDSGALALGNLTVSNGRIAAATGVDAAGGCITSASSLALAGVTVTGCSAQGGGPTAAPTPVTGSGRGGGVYISGGTATIVNSTISGNSAIAGGPLGTSAGAGIYLASGTATLSSATIANGTAAAGAGIYAGAGGMVTVQNTILSDSTTDDCDTESGGTVLSSGWNLVRAPGNCANFSPVSNDQVSGNAQLGPLQNNGGPTFTHAVGQSSSAFERGRCSLATDQRGIRRLRQPTKCEVGAFEVTRFLLHLFFQGNGSGTVTSNIGSTICSGDCDTIELAGSGDELVASADPGSTFTGWDVACSGTGPCDVFFNSSDQTVAVTFQKVVTPPSPDAPTGGGAPDAPVSVADAPVLVADAPIGGGDIDAGGGGGDIDAGGGGGNVDAGGGGGGADGGAVADAGAAVDAGSRDAGAADGGSGGGTPDAPGGSGTILPLDHGCGCHVGADPTEMPSLLLLVGLTFWIVRRGRRRRAA